VDVIFLFGYKISIGSLR